MLAINAAKVCRMTQPKRRMPAKPGWADVPPRDWGEREAHRIATEIRRLRKPRSAQWLAARTAAIGFPISRALIADIELGRRRYVTVAELTVLAMALETSPVALVYPPPYDETVSFMPGLEVTKRVAVELFCGFDTALENTYPLTADREIASLERSIRDFMRMLADPAIGESAVEAQKLIDAYRRDIERVQEKLERWYREHGWREDGR